MSSMEWGSVLPTSALCVCAGVWVAKELVNAIGKSRKSVQPLPFPEQKMCPSESVLMNFHEKAIEFGTTNKALVEVVQRNTGAVERQTAAAVSQTEALVDQNCTLVKLAEVIKRRLGDG